MKQKSKVRTSKHKKKYWKKGINLVDVEEHVGTQRHNEIEGGRIAERKDEELFVIDTTSQHEPMRLTRRQKVAMEKREMLARQEDDEAKPSKRSLKRSLTKNMKKKRVPSLRKTTVSESVAEKAKDLWANEEPEDFPTGQEFFEKVTKKKLPKKPATLNHITTLLPNVDLPEAGVSYNPTQHDYESYVKTIVDEELKMERRESKLKAKLMLAPGENYVTAAEKFHEESAGLFDTVKEEEIEDASTSENEAVEKPKVKLPSQKTKKSLQRRALERKKQLEKKRKDKEKAEGQQIFRVRKLKKEVTNLLLERKEKAELRKKNKAMRKLLGPQKNRSVFQDAEKPFLLPEEMTGSLRLLKPQGNIILERLKSFEKRNVLPVPIKRKKHSLKKKLKVKKIEKRSHKDVTVGSHLKR